MRLTATRSVEVDCFDALAELAALEPRPALARLCQMATEADGRLAAEDVPRVLPGLGARAAANVVRHATTLGLCDRHGILTAAGRRCAETTLAPIPEAGVYGFAVVDDPLLGHRVIAATRRAPDHTPGRGLDAIDPSSLPRGEHATLTDDATVRVDRLLFNGPRPVVGGRTRATAELQWHVTVGAAEGLWLVEGMLPDERGALDGRPRPHPVEDGWGAFAAFAERALAPVGRWDATLRRLRVSLDALDADARATFACAIELTKPELPPLGEFATGTLEDVPLAARDRATADAWLLDRLVAAVRADAAAWPRARVIDTAATLAAHPALAPERPTVPAHDALLDALDGADYWRVAAPVDLCPTAPARLDAHHPDEAAQ